MMRFMTLGGVLCVVLAAPPDKLFAQFIPYGNNRYDPYAAAGDPRLRRAYREKAVAEVGPIARDFVETMGDEAVAAIFACSRPVAVMLAEFYASGGMGKLPRPRGLLYVIAQPRHGDDVAVWAIRHAGELADADSFDAYLISPLDYAMGLKPLAAGAAEVRERRNQAAMTGATAANERLVIAGGAGILIIAGLLLWRRRRSSVG
jgi:hypothetical protein